MLDLVNIIRVIADGHMFESYDHYKDDIKINKDYKHSDHINNLDPEKLCMIKEKYMRQICKDNLCKSYWDYNTLHHRVEFFKKLGRVKYL